MNQQTLTADQALDIARTKLQQGNFPEARDIFEKILKAEPDNFLACVGLSHATLPGHNYMDNLKNFHSLLRPNIYVEIGIETGKTLALATPPTIAVGIDPEPKVNVDFITKTEIFPVTSDAFFQENHLPYITGKDTVDMAFLDGLHVFSQTLRDFMNIEKFANNNTVILIHDCLPLNQFTATAKRQSTFWSGDPWKIIPILKHYRPDLSVHVIPAQPTGLGVITNLDPNSTALNENWDAIIAEYTDMPYSYTLDNRTSELNIIENNWENIQNVIGNNLP